MAKTALVPILVCLSALAAQSEKVSVEFGECSSAPHAETAAALLQNAQSKRMAPLEKIFDTLDVNNDSMLDPSEFKPWYESHAGATKAPAVDASTDAATMATMAVATSTMAAGAPTTDMAAGTSAPAAATAMAGTTNGMAAGTTAMPGGSTPAAADITAMAGGTTGMAAGTTGMAAGTTAGAAATGMAAGTTVMAAAATTAVPMKKQGTTAPIAEVATKVLLATTAAPEMTAAPETTAAPIKPTNRTVAQVLKYVATTPGNASGHVVRTNGKPMVLGEPTGDLQTGHLRYMGVFPKTDMIVTAVDGYQAHQPNQNGVTKGYGTINVMGGTSTTFKFSFVHSGTDSPVVIDELYFSLISMTRTGSMVKEATMVSGFEHVYLDPGTTVEWYRRDGSSPSVFKGSIDVPAYSALDGDRRKSVGFRFLTVGDFMIKLGLPGGSSDMGRNFFFGGRGPIVTGQCIDATPVNNAYFSQVGYSNLGGMGPSFASPRGIQYKHVLEVEDENSELGYIPVDIMVKNTLGDYHPSMSELNGCSGGAGIGSINFEAGTVATFSFSLVNNALKEMPQQDFVLTFMDIDKSPRGGTTDSFILHGFKNAYLSENSAFEMTEVEKGFKKFTATINDDPFARKTKPSNAFDLTVEQQQRSFSVEFSSASIITLKVDFSELPEGYSRTLYFAGHSRLSAGREVPYICEGKK